LRKIFLTQLAIKLLFEFLPHPTSVFAQPRKTRPSIIRVKVNENTSINFIYLNLRTLAISKLQSSTDMQQRRPIYQMTFRNVYEFKKWLDWSGADHYWHCRQWMQKACLL